MKNNIKTLADLISELKALADEYGADTPVFLYDDYLANEGWDYTLRDLYLAPRAVYAKAEEEEKEDGVPENFILIK